ncbi:MAG: BamA/TamA family outer membrane protein [Desulfobacteraceae bacterium]|nr:BamA/TamA family outer membrane protein [Desulfobacteraceae bacterium]
MTQIRPVLLYTLIAASLLLVPAPASGNGLPPCTPVDKLELSGNHAFSDIRLKLRTKLWSATLMPGKKECLNRDWLKRDKRNLIAFYRKKGFADAAITHEIVKQEKGENHTLRLIIREGLEYRVSFQGASFYYPWQLGKEIDIFEKGNLEDRGLKKGARNIRKRYRTAGFKDAGVTFTKKKITEKNKELWEVTYLIKENERLRVAHIAIRGNARIPEEDIRKVILISEKSLLKQGGFSRDILDEDIKAIKRLYLSRGFTKTTVKEEVTVRQDEPGEAKQDEPEKLVHIKLTIHEGDQTQVSTSTITGLDGLLSEKAVIPQLALRPGEPFRQYMVKSDENVIASLVSAKGYPHVRVKGTVSPTESGRAENLSLSFQVDKGPFTRVGKIVYTGQTRLKTGIMSELLKIEPHDPFSLKEILAAEKRLRKIRAVKSVRIQAHGLREKTGTADLEVIVEEKKPYYIETALGHDTERLLYLNVEAGDNNYLGRDIDAWIRGEVSGIGYEGEAGIKDPFFMDTDMTASTTLFVQDKEERNHDFSVKAWGFSGTLTKPLLTNFNAGVSLTYENRLRSGGEDDTGDSKDSEDAFQTRNILKTSLSLAYDSRDSVVRPKSGLLSSLTTDIYTGFGNDLDKFIRYGLDVRKYHSPLNRVTLAFRTRLGYIQPFSSSSTVAEDRLFFLGGTSDIRGFKENMLAYDPDEDPVGGKSMISASLESRIALTDSIEFILFWDGGRLDRLDGNTPDQGFRSSLGGGFSYVTAIGPISLLYGHKLDRKDEESPGQIHFSIGYTF